MIVLTSGNVKTDGRRVVILEVGQFGVADGFELVRHGSASWASESGDDGRSARPDRKGAEVGLNGWGICVVRALSSNADKVREVDASSTGEGVGRRLQLSLSGEIKYQAACLASV